MESAAAKTRRQRWQNAAISNKLQQEASKFNAQQQKGAITNQNQPTKATVRTASNNSNKKPLASSSATINTILLIADVN